jgi:hypothetical protein
MSKVSFFLIVTLVVSGCRPVAIGTEVIEGLVSNTKNEPIASARVLLDDYFELTTDSEGYFCLEELMSPPEIAIRVEATGYRPLDYVLSHGDFSVKVTLEGIDGEESRLEAFALTKYVPFYCNSKSNRSKGLE